MGLPNKDDGAEVVELSGLNENPPVVEGVVLLSATDVASLNENPPPPPPLEVVELAPKENVGPVAEPKLNNGLDSSFFSSASLLSSSGLDGVTSGLDGVTSLLVLVVEAARLNTGVESALVAVVLPLLLLILLRCRS